MTTGHGPGRRVVYSVLTGNYETLLEQPAASGSPVDFVCFTDDPSLTSATWDVRLLTPTFPADPARSSREPKILAHRFLREYAASLYIDNSVLLTRPAAEIFDRLLPPGCSLAVLRHSFRGPLSEEFDAVDALRLDGEWTVREQREHYQRLDPGALDAPTLWGGMVLRAHGDPSVRHAMELWWLHVLRYSRRDQLSLPFVLRAVGLAPLVHEIDNNLSAFHEWPHWPAGRPRAYHRRVDDPASAQVAALTAALAYCDEARRGLEHALADERAARADLVRRATHLEQWRDDAVERMRAIESSTSWHVTAPLRAATRRWRARTAAAAERQNGPTDTPPQ